MTYASNQLILILTQSLHISWWEIMIKKKTWPWNQRNKGLNFNWSSTKCILYSSVQSLNPVWLFATPWTTAHLASQSITDSRSPPRPMSIELVMPSDHFISVIPFSSCPQSFSASGSFQMSQLFASGGQSIGVSASTSVFPMDTQDWSPYTYKHTFS